MVLLRIEETCWKTLVQHCTASPGEHFAFLHACVTRSRNEPMLVAHYIVPIHDDEVTCDKTGWQVSLDALLSVVNGVVNTADALIEVHNHTMGPPGFSTLDREELENTKRFMFDSLPARPYAAMVVAGDQAYAECFSADGSRHVFDRITIVGACPYPVARTDATGQHEPVFDRQLPWFAAEGQERLAQRRVGIVGLGGIGSHVAQLLAYLGIRDFVLIDPDRIEASNLNRVVTAQRADLDMYKVDAARRVIRAIAPDAKVQACSQDLRSSVSIDAIRGVDLIFGCVDNDGARLILNELALAYLIPYFDLATGIDVDGDRVVRAGGRLAFVAPGGPCLHCMGEIDPEEARYFLEPADRQVIARQRGYVSGINAPAPAVVSLNGAVANAAVNEFAVLASRLRPHNAFLELDLLGTAGTQNQAFVTRRVTKDDSCVECTKAGQGDQVDSERFGRALSPTQKA